MRLDLAQSVEDKKELLTEKPAVIKFNMGCGNDWMFNGIINIDCRNLVPPDGAIFLRGDVSDLKGMFDDECADEIWAKDVLEHFPQKKGPEIVQEWVRLLKPGGKITIKSPDIYALANFVLQGTEDDEVKAYRIYGGQTYAENFHTAGYSVPMIKKMLETSGVKVLSHSTVEGTNLLVVGQKMKRGGGNGSGNAR